MQTMHQLRNAQAALDEASENLRNVCNAPEPDQNLIRFAQRIYHETFVCYLATLDRYELASQFEQRGYFNYRH